MADIEQEQNQQAARPAPGGTFAPFRYPTFRAIWIANLVSIIGSTLESVAAAWLMTDLTDSHQLIAMVQASVLLPVMLLGIFAGAIADNFDRRRIMLAAQIGMLLASTVLAVLAWEGWITPYLLLALTLSVGIGTALNAPAWQASVRQQVSLQDLPQAITLNSISFNLARSVGPAVGGLLISIWNVALAFTLNAFSYIAMIVVLWRWRPEVQKMQRTPMLQAIGIGVRFCISSSPIRRVLTRSFLLGFGIAGYQALIPIVVRDRLKGDEIDFGLMLGLFGVGSIVTALFIGQARRRWGTETLLAVAAVSFAAAQILLASVQSVIPALPSSLLAGVAWVSMLTTLNVAMQMRSPDNILGRCLSIYQAVTFGGMAIGAWFWGALSDWQDLSFALYSAGGFLLVTTLVARQFAPMPLPDEGRVHN